MNQYVKLHDILRAFVDESEFKYHDNVLKIKSFLMNALQYDYV